MFSRCGLFSTAAGGSASHTCHICVSPCLVNGFSDTLLRAPVLSCRWSYVPSPVVCTRNRRSNIFVHSASVDAAVKNHLRRLIDVAAPICAPVGRPSTVGTTFVRALV